MTRAVVVGAGVGGLGSALALARQGHEVQLLERDRVALPASPAEAFDTWQRRGVPQARHSHAFLARLRNLLRDSYPDVLEDLLEAGATEIRFCDALPETIADRSARAGDDDLVALACRRTTFEWVLRKAVEASGNVEIRGGVTVTGLAGETTPCGVPQVRGVLTDEVPVRGDLVVVATGHRSGLTDWLGHLGVEPTVTEQDSGIVYLSRFYRLHDDAERPVTTGPVAGDLDYLKYAVFQGDDRTFSVTLAVASGDGELRARLRDSDAFTRAAAALEPAAAWVSPTRAAPVTEVAVMGGLRNRKVDFLGSSGDPIVVGLAAVGDCHTATNPLYGRGCPLAMVQADLLKQALDQHPDDPVGLARAYEQACEEEITPWYLTAVAQDTAAQRALQVRKETPTGDAAVDPGDLARDIIRNGILPAARTNPEVFRAFLRSFNLLDPPEAMMTDPAVTGPVMEAYSQRHERPPEDVPGPARDEMLALLAV